MKNFKAYFLIGLIGTVGVLSSCSDDDAPAAENEEEVIDLITLTFTPQEAGGIPVVATAVDPDGAGAADYQTQTINLQVNTAYDLAITLANTEEGENITEEIEEEDDEHMFFFSFTNGIFSDPAGNGNRDNREDDVNYNDKDADGNPVGLSTTWTTATVASSDGNFRVILKHQPGIKSATSTATDGESDIDITWTINVSE